MFEERIFSGRASCLAPPANERYLWQDLSVRAIRPRDSRCLLFYLFFFFFTFYLSYFFSLSLLLLLSLTIDDIVVALIAPRRIGNLEMIIEI